MLNVGSRIGVVRFVVAVAAFVCGGKVSLAAFPPNYRIGNIAGTNGCFDGPYPVCEALGISEDGNKTVGRGNDSCSPPVGSLRGFWLNLNDETMPSLHTFGGTCSQAWAVLSSGRAVGSADEAQGVLEWQRPASFWPGVIPIEDLGTLGLNFFDTGHAFDIDSANRVVGRSELSDAVRATYWQQVSGAWQATNLDILPGDDLSEARGKNNNNDIVGFSQSAAGVQRAVIWEPSGPLSWTMTPLPSLGGNSIAWNINNSKGVVGVSGITPTAVRWQFVAGQWQITALPTLGGNSSTAYAINSQGDIVGYSRTGGANTEHAVVWTSDGAIHDLQQLLCRFVDLNPSHNWTLKEARAINDSGKICGSGLRNTGQPPVQVQKPFQLAPILCTGDVDGSGVVDIVDFLQLLSEWGPGCGPSDIVHNGAVDVVDFLALLQNWCCGAAPPCPAFPTSAQQCIDRYWPDTVRIAACITALNLMP